MSGKAAHQWLTDSLSKSTRYISFCSAYLRSEALGPLLHETGNGTKGRILARWQMGDLLTGASDLQAYPLARDAGWEFAIRLDFHGKVFALPDQGIVVGSANATMSGFSMHAGANAEVCTLVPAEEQNLQLINGLFDSAIVMTDTVFAEITRAIEAATDSPWPSPTWPEALMSKLQVPEDVDRLFSSECFWTLPQLDEECAPGSPGEHDRHLLGLPLAAISRELALPQFMHSKLYRWLVQHLQQAGGELYFGTLTQCLHNSLLDDPGVYRSAVKELVQHLLAWCQHLPECDIKVDRPNHSQRVRLINR